MASINITPFRKGVAVVPSDSTVLGPTRGLYIGGAGNVSVQFFDGTQAVFTAPPVGTILPFAVTKVLAATTATLIVALY